MGNRRGVQVSSEDEEPVAVAEDLRRRKESRLLHEEGEDDANKDKNQPEKNAEGEVGEAESESAVDQDEDTKAEPIGNVLRISGKGNTMKNHYGSFEFEGNVFELEDSVLLIPEDSKLKPYVAIIKDITEDVDGNLMLTGQWLYRPEETERKGWGNWQASDPRELFYSFHLDDVPAESVMHKCAVHFVPLHKKLPIRSQNPGFIVQKVYDAAERKLWNLTYKDYEDGKQHEIDLLVQKTRERLGELPDLEPEEAPGDHHDQSMQKAQAGSKWYLRSKTVPYIDAHKADLVSTRFDSATKAEIPGACGGDLSEYDAVLKKFNALTTDSHQNADGNIDGSSNVKRIAESVKSSTKGFFNSDMEAQLNDMEKTEKNNTK